MEQDTAARPDQPGPRANRACRDRVSIKANCKPLTDALTNCERCHRLSKSCTTLAPTPRRVQRTFSKAAQLRTEPNNLTAAPSSRATSELPTLGSSYDLSRPCSKDSHNRTARSESGPSMTEGVYTVSCSARTASPSMHSSCLMLALQQVASSEMEL